MQKEATFLHCMTTEHMTTNSLTTAVVFQSTDVKIEIGKVSKNTGTAAWSGMISGTNPFISSLVGYGRPQNNLNCESILRREA